ncbi:hypothetical protein [Nonomuraea lactucae]|nr:hypothetical protein [Nonomuraea lactucae]
MPTVYELCAAGDLLHNLIAARRAEFFGRMGRSTDAAQSAHRKSSNCAVM